MRLSSSAPDRAAPCEGLPVDWQVELAPRRGWADGDRDRRPQGRAVIADAETWSAMRDVAGFEAVDRRHGADDGGGQGGGASPRTTLAKTSRQLRAAASAATSA